MVHASDLATGLRAYTEGNPMAKCIITGKKKSFGLSRSFSLQRNKRAWNANIQRRRMMIDGRMQTVTISAKALRTLAKDR
jgi:large subunit ribosomal protein L28